MLIDKVKVAIIGGKGGNGCISFRREKFIPKGGPDGGNGGRGSKVYIEGINNIRYLRKYREKPIIQAQAGKPGGPNKRAGAGAPKLTIKVPFGTQITDLQEKKTLDVLSHSPTRLLVKGGRGGRGNWEFRSSTNQAPRRAEVGKLGEKKQFIFELKLIADVGLVGLPNAGKSTLLNALTKAQAIIGAYPFTTLEPNLGTLNNLIIADLPGLIEGAAKGKGLGDQFLKHVARTKLIVHCLSCESTNPLKDYKVIRRELKDYDPGLSKQTELFIVTKSDLLNEAQQKRFKLKIKSIAKKPLFVSALNNSNLDLLKKRLKELSKK